MTTPEESFNAADLEADVTKTADKQESLIAPELEPLVNQSLQKARAESAMNIGRMVEGIKK